jgi:putative transposase
MPGASAPTLASGARTRSSADQLLSCRLQRSPRTECLALENPRAFYELLFISSSASALEMAADPEHLGAEIGMIAILHTWGQNLLLHPHIHCVIPAGGLSPDHQHWVSSRYHFFVPVKALRRVFRGKFIDGLKRFYRRKKLGCTGPAAVFSEPKQFAKLVGRLRRQDWVVYVKPAFGGPLQVLRYLGRYTHRIAISNHRLLAFDGEHVTFRWRDYAHGNKSGMMTLHAIEFLRRFFLHVLPKGFVRIRHFGFLANCFRADRLELCRKLLDCAVSEPARTSLSASTWCCPRCGALMIILTRMTSQELSSRCTFFDSS